MVFLKNYFASTTEEIDFIPIIHDVRFALRDSQVVDGLATISIPAEGAILMVSPLKPEELEKPEKLRSPPKASDAFEGGAVSLSIPFQKKELVLDPKQMIYLVDFSDSGKRREFYVQVLGDAPQPQTQQPQGGRRRA